MTVLDVVNANDPIERIRECLLGLHCHTKLCPLHAELDRVYAATEEAFTRVTIRQLAESAGPLNPMG